ncbi:MAG: LysM peptidoglycan-binding domain-containing protein [Bacillota bacterium]
MCGKITRKSLPIIAIGLMGLSGCSILSMKSESDDATAGNSSNGFKATVSQSANPIPMPIEVATEISQIAAGKTKAPPTIMTPENVSAPRDLASSESDEETASAVSPSPDHKSANIKHKNAKKVPSSGGKSSSYKVHSGDTLMKISFEKFGDIYRWREIYESNKDKISNFNILIPGTILTISGVEYVVIEKNGEPYLIKRNDTLVKISKWLYGTSDQWKSLWTNNRQLIHNPNKIYAGFTLYYKPKNQK